MAVDPDAFRDFEPAAHDRLAETYTKLFTPITKLFTPITKLALGPLLAAAGVVSGMRVLDVATGPGLAAAAARDRGTEAVGVDLSPRMALPFPDGAFSAVICNFGLGHFPRPEAAVAECVRILAPAGALAMSWWDDPARQRVQGLFRELACLRCARPNATAAPSASAAR